MRASTRTHLRQFVCRLSILDLISVLACSIWALASELEADFGSLQQTYSSLSFRICTLASSTCSSRHREFAKARLVHDVSQERGLAACSVQRARSACTRRRLNHAGKSAHDAQIKTHLVVKHSNHLQASLDDLGYLELTALILLRSVRQVRPQSFTRSCAQTLLHTEDTTGPHTLQEHKQHRAQHEVPLISRSGLVQY